jgi:hypothetical protein
MLFMRWKWAVVVIVVSSIPFSSVGAETFRNPYRLLQVSEPTSRQGTRQISSDLVPTTRPANKIPDNKTTRLRDLFPKDISDKLGTPTKSNNLSFEPWVPGRGAVGVRLEVTW